MSRAKATEILLNAAREYEKLQKGGEGYVFTDEEMKELMRAVYAAWLDEMANGINRMLSSTGDSVEFQREYERFWEDETNG